MSPEEAIVLLKDQRVIQQLIELTRDPGVVKRLGDIAGGETAREHVIQLLRSGEMADAINILIHHTALYQRLHGLMWAGAILVGIGAALLALNLVLAIYNTAQLRRLLRERGEE